MKGQMDMIALYTRRNKEGLMALLVRHFQRGQIDDISQPLIQLCVDGHSNGADIGHTINQVPEQEL